MDNPGCLTTLDIGAVVGSSYTCRPEFSTCTTNNLLPVNLPTTEKTTASLQINNPMNDNNSMCTQRELILNLNEDYQENSFITNSPDIRGLSRKLFHRK